MRDYTNMFYDQSERQPTIEDFGTQRSPTCYAEASKTYGDRAHSGCPRKASQDKNNFSHAQQAAFGSVYLQINQLNEGAFGVSFNNT